MYKGDVCMHLQRSIYTNMYIYSYIHIYLWIYVYVDMLVDSAPSGSLGSFPMFLGHPADFLPWCGKLFLRYSQKARCVHYPKALRTYILRQLGPKTILYEAFGLF